MHPEKDYFEHLAAGRFMLQRVPVTAGGLQDAGGWVYPPRMAHPASGATNLEWLEASGRGTVYSTTVIRQKPPAQSYNLALIDLDEGVRMTARVDGVAPEAVKIGMAVRARIVRENDQPLVVFVPAGGGDD
jgi:uncharacterized OB-fold protein